MHLPQNSLNKTDAVVESEDITYFVTVQSLCSLSGCSQQSQVTALRVPTVDSSHLYRSTNLCLNFGCLVVFGSIEMAADVINRSDISNLFDVDAVHFRGNLLILLKFGYQKVNVRSEVHNVLHQLVLFGIAS